MKDKKQFALEQIAPYFKDPSTCGFDGISCEYLNKEGKMCVAGKNMLDPKSFNKYGIISDVFDKYTQEQIFKPEVVGILTNEQWLDLQSIHDSIAATNISSVERSIKNLNLFTYEELVEFCKN